MRKYAERQALGTAHTEVKDASGKVVIDDRGKPVLKALPETCQPGETVPILPSKLNVAERRDPQKTEQPGKLQPSQAARSRSGVRGLLLRAA